MCKFTVLILLLLLLTSCNNKNDSLLYPLYNTKNTPLEFYINNEDVGLEYADFDRVYLLCKLFLTEFYNATTINETMNVEPYINNDNLKEYILQKVETGMQISANKIEDLIFGVKDIEWHLNEGYVFIELIVDIEQEIGGFGEGHQFLISNKDGRLLISDWYSKSAGSVSHLDGIIRGHITKIDNPNIWDDEEWVNNIFTTINRM